MCFKLWKGVYLGVKGGTNCVLVLKVEVIVYPVGKGETESVI